ncbi:unnamed protein product [Owenia fusiformis]|uniref:G-protein coupled receptors family 1 profile domain-containing protein n=1 Tax=Owenia fusiformis TaxID=6347 RepID=A0A8S4NRH0_OWEFU|nr:unnamed protein product [Owenia fusiformis]
MNSSAAISDEEIVDLESNDTILMFDSDYMDILLNMSGSTSDEMIDHRVIADIVKSVNLYCIPFIVLAGIIGNSLSLLVFTCSHLKRVSSSVYLSALSITDTGLLVMIFIVWLESVNVSTYHKNGWCQLVEYMSHVCAFLSVWFIISFTVERYIAIFHPGRSQEMCTTKRSIGVVILMVFIGCSGYLSIIWTVHAQKFGRFYMCIALPQYRHLLTGVATANVVLNLIVPIVAIAVLNMLITQKIAAFYNTKTFIENEVHGRRERNTSYRTQITVTRILLIVSSVYLMLNMPFYCIQLHLFMMNHVKDTWTPSPSESLWRCLFQIVHYVSFSIKFYLYTLYSTRFRYSLKGLFTKYKFIWSKRMDSTIRRRRSPTTERDTFAMMEFY